MQKHPSGQRIPSVEINAYAKRETDICVSIRDLTNLQTQLSTEEKLARFNGEKKCNAGCKIEGELKSPISSISGFSKGFIRWYCR